MGINAGILLENTMRSSNGGHIISITTMTRTSRMVKTTRRMRIMNQKVRKKEKTRRLMGKKRICQKPRTLWTARHSNTL